MQIGDRVTHYKYGQGVVERLVAGGLAEVRFKRKLEYVQQENLTSIEEEERAARARREAQVTEAANRRAKQEEKERQRKIELEQAEARRELERQIREHMTRSYRTVDQFFNGLDSAIMSEADFRDLKTQFVKHWLAKSQPQSTASKPLYVDDGQALAIATVEGHVQVVARAGSGKTTTVVNRALFLIRHCNVPPGSILLLAFNRKAALEIQRKVLEVLVTGAKAAIEEEFKALRRRDRDKRYSPLELEARAVAAVRSKAGVSLPHALTFHALAYAIVHPEETLLYDDVEANSLSLSGTIQRVIDRLLHEPETHATIRALMLDHFRSDWDSIVAGKYDLGRDEFLSYRRSIPHQTLNGEAVKSYGEKLIADFFFEHDVAYKYEKNHWWHRRNYRPDFTLHTAPDEGLIVEYFGLKGDPEYDEMTEEKRAYWRTKKSWHLVEVYPADVARENGELAREILRSSLAKAGIRCAKLSEDEIWSRVRERAVDRFSRSVRSFVGKCRQKSIQPMNLRSMIDGHQASGEAEERFLEIAHRVYVEYLDEISRNNQEDFSGLLQRASDLISDGRTVFENRFGVGDLGALEYIFVDEYQDFSELFHRLLDEVRRHAPEARLFCVGDDWQAINSFAGSELRFFTEFSRYIGENDRLELSTNYRSDKAVVSVGNELMKGLGRPARAQSDAPGAVIVADLADFAPSFIESERHRGDGLTPGILRIVQRSLGEGRDVVLLQRQQYIPAYINMDAWGGGRRLRDPTFLDLIRSYFPEELAGRIQQSTVHKYKGLEKPTVILLDAVARSFPLVHPDWIFTRVLGDSPDQIISEERRLFYVAVTRAVHELVLVTRGKEISPFLEPLLRLSYVNRLDWDRYIPVSGEAKHVALQVGNTHPKSGDGTFAIRDLLKNDGYKWQTSKWQHWVKEMPEQSLDFESIKNETWATQADGVEVRLVDDRGQLRERHVIRRGEWRKL